MQFSPVNGNGIYPSPSIHVGSPGTYNWIANYDGDASNSATQNVCGAANESVTVINPTRRKPRPRS